jgi:alpha-1,2-mannosyltransferase
VAAAQWPWLAVAAVAALAGLAAAVALHRRGRAFAGLTGCALTALLVSPISWDHHWVWVAPGLALLLDAGARAATTRARASWCALAAATWAAFAAWPDFWSAKAGLLQGGLIGYAPASAWAHGDNPAYAEYHWRGLQLLAGNLELLAGLALFAVLLAAAFAPRPRHRGSAAARARLPRKIRAEHRAGCGNGPLMTRRR